MSDAKKLDQFYTKSNIALYYYQVLEKKYILSNFLLFEPSAGTGSFSDLFTSHSISIDLQPKKDSILKKDFFSITKNFFDTKKPIFTIGNPPFGKNSSLALKFINNSAQYSDYIAFILPKTFKKESLQNKIDLQLHLVFEENTPQNSFIHEGQEYDVPCVFQIWKKKKNLRQKVNIKSTTQLFQFSNKDEADFAIRRVGRLAGKVIINFKEYKESSHYYIKANKIMSKKELIDKINLLYNQIQNVSKNTAGNPSLSKHELITILEGSILNS